MQNKEEQRGQLKDSREIDKGEKFDEVDLKGAFEKIFTSEVINDYLRKYTENNREERTGKLKEILVELSIDLANDVRSGVLDSNNEEAVTDKICSFLESKRYGRLVKIIKGEEIGLVENDFIKDVEEAGMGELEEDNQVETKAGKDSTSKAKEHEDETLDTKKEEAVLDDIVESEPEAVSEQELEDKDAIKIAPESEKVKSEFGDKDPSEEFFESMKLDPEKVYANKKDGRQMKVVGYNNDMVQVIFLPKGTRKDEEGVNVISLDSDWEDGIDEQQIKLSSFLALMKEYDEIAEGELNVKENELAGDGTALKVDSMEFKNFEKQKGDIISLDGLMDLFGVVGSKHQTKDGNDSLEIVSYYYRRSDTEWDVKIKESGDKDSRKVSPDELQNLLADKYTEKNFSPQEEPKMKKAEYEDFREKFGRTKEFVYENSQKGGPFVISKLKYSKQRRQNQVKIQLMKSPASFWISAKGVDVFAKKDEKGVYSRIPLAEYVPENENFTKDSSVKDVKVETKELGEIAKQPEDLEKDLEVGEIFKEGVKTSQEKTVEGGKVEGVLVNIDSQGKDIVKAKGIDNSDLDIIDAGWEEIKDKQGQIEHKPEKKELSPDQLSQKNMNDSFENWKTTKVNFEKKAAKLNIVKKNLAKMGISFGNDAEAMKELINAKQSMKDAEAGFKNAHSDFAELTTKKRRGAIENSSYANESIGEKITGKKREERKKLMHEYMYTEKVIDSEKLDENGERVVEKITLMQDLHNKMLDLNLAKKEALSEKDKSIVKKLFEKYSNFSKAQKIAIGVTLAGTLGATSALAGGAAAGVAIGAGASTGTARLVRSLISGAASAKVFASTRDKLSSSRTERVKKMEKGRLGKYLKGKENIDLVSMMQKKMNVERNDNIKAMAAAGITGFAVGGGVKAFTDFEFIDPADFDTNASGHSIGERVMGKLGVKYDSANGNATFVGNDPIQDVEKNVSNLSSEAGSNNAKVVLKNGVVTEVNGEKVPFNELTSEEQAKVLAARSAEGGTNSDKPGIVAEENIEIDPEEQSFTKACSRFEEKGFQDTDVYREFQARFTPKLHEEFIEKYTSRDGIDSEKAEQLWQQKIMTDEQAFMGSAKIEHRFDLASGIAKEMGIDFDRIRTEVKIGGLNHDVPIEIDGKKIPIELLTEDQQKSLVLEREASSATKDVVDLEGDEETAKDKAEAEKNIEIGSEDQAFARSCLRFEKRSFQDTDAYKRFQTRFGPEAHEKFLAEHFSGEGVVNEDAESLWRKKLRRGEKSFMMRAETDHQLDLAEGIAKKMGIEVDRDNMKITSEGLIPTVIDGERVPMELFTEEQQRHILFAREMRAGSGDAVLSRDDAERIADFRLANSQKIMDHAGELAKKMGIEFDPEKTEVMQESGIPTRIGGKEVPMELSTKQEQGGILFSREFGDIEEKVSLVRQVPEFGDVSETTATMESESLDQGNETAQRGPVLSRKTEMEGLEPTILTSEELSQKLEGLKINEKDGAWRALRGMTMKQLQDFPRTKADAVVAWRGSGLNLPPDAKATLGFFDIREAGRMGRMAGIALKELENTEIADPEKITLENALKGDFASVDKNVETLETEQLDNVPGKEVETSGSQEVVGQLGETDQPIIEPVENLKVAEDSAERGVGPKEVPIESVLDTKLKPGEDVWEKVAEHYGGDQGETAKTMVSFEKNMSKELLAKGMSQQKANDFIDWRFRHLKVGQEIKLDQDGLIIKNFVEPKSIESFGSKYAEDIARAEEELAELDDPAKVVDVEGINNSSSIDIELMEASMNDELMNAGIEIDSKIWHSVKNISVAKLLEEVPASKEDVASIWKTKEGLVNIKELKQESILDGVSYDEFKELQKISNMLSAWNPNATELSMQADDYLRFHVGHSMEDMDNAFGTAQNVPSEGLQSNNLAENSSSSLEVTADNFLDRISDKERALFADTEGKKFLASVQIAADKVKTTDIQAKQFYQENSVGIKVADDIYNEVGFSEKNISTSIITYLEKGNSLTKNQLTGLAKLIENVQIVGNQRKMV